MFRFEENIFLWALAILPVLAGFFLITWRMRRQALARFGGEAVVRRLTPGLSKYKHIVKFSLLLIALAFIIIALANPQWGNRRQVVKQKGIELFIALDISQSMLAQDVPPSRLERAKYFSQQLIDQLAGHQIGVILFACNAFPVAPLTSDYNFAKLALATANPDQAGSQGTSISAAMELAEGLFNVENKAHKAIIIISDGEDHDELAMNKAKAVYENGTLVYTIGVGTEQGGFIPIRNKGREDFLRNESETPVRTQFNNETLKQIARAGGGAYFKLAKNAAALAEDIQTRIDNIEKREYEQQVYSNYEGYFQPFIALALLLLLIEFLLSYKSSSLRRSSRKK